MRTLHEIGMETGTDKAIYHGFTHVYDNIFSPIRNENLKLLEVGIASGASVKMWEEYFPNAKIYAADIFDYKYLDNEKTKTFIMNQEVEEDLMKVDNDFDIIIDDGGHTMKQQQNSLKILFTQKLKSGGYYILEDLHTSDPSYYIQGADFGQTHTNNTLGLLYALKSDEWPKDMDYYVTRGEFYTILDHIASIEFFHLKYGSVTSLIRKK